MRRPRERLRAFLAQRVARGLERQRLQTSYGSAEAGPAPGGPEQGFLRSVALVREDGDAAARFRFRGTELVGSQFEEGGLVARRADGEEYSASGAEEPARTPADEALPRVKDLSAAVPSGASLAAPQARRVE